MKIKKLAHLCMIIGALLASFALLYTIFSVSWGLGVFVLGAELFILGFNIASKD